MGSVDRTVLLTTCCRALWLIPVSMLGLHHIHTKPGCKSLIVLNCATIAIRELLLQGCQSMVGYVKTIKLWILVLSILPSGNSDCSKTPMHSFYSYKSLKGSLPVITIHTRIEPTSSNYLFISLAARCIQVFYMGIHNAK